MTALTIVDVYCGCFGSDQPETLILNVTIVNFGFGEFNIEVSTPIGCFEFVSSVNDFKVENVEQHTKLS